MFLLAHSAGRCAVLLRFLFFGLWLPPSLDPGFSSPGGRVPPSTSCFFSSTGCTTSVVHFFVKCVGQFLFFFLRTNRRLFASQCLGLLGHFATNFFWLLGLAFVPILYSIPAIKRPSSVFTLGILVPIVSPRIPVFWGKYLGTQTFYLSLHCSF